MKIKINKQINKYIGTILLLIVATIISPELGILFSYLCVSIGLLYDNKFSIYYFVGFCFIQNILMLFTANRFSQNSTTLFFLSKEIMIYGIVAFNIVKYQEKKVYKLDLFFLIYSLSLLAAFGLSNAAVSSRIFSLREMLLPFVCFYYGLIAKFKNFNLKKFCKYIIFLGLFVAVFGLLERFILGDAFWQNLPINRYQSNKGTTFELYHGVPLNYYTWDYITITHNIERRLVSILVDPLMSAHFMFLSFVLCDYAYEKSQKRSIIKLVLFVSAMLTLCKGIYIGFIIYLTVRLLRKTSFSTVKRFIRFGLIFCLIMTAFGYKFVASYMPQSSILIHMNGLMSIFDISNPLGNGLGTAGTITSKLTAAQQLNVAESFVAVLHYQLGIVGLVIYFAFMIYLFISLFRYYYITKIDLYLSSAILLLSIFIESFFSESSISIIGTGLYFIFAGLAVSIYRKQENNFAYSRPSFYKRKLGLAK